MQLFFNSELDANSKQIVFEKQESRHIVKVLRKSVGDQLRITNGKGYLFTGRISSADPKQCRIEIEEHQFTPPSPYQLHIGIAPTKRNERLEWFLEKATEIGIHQITPLFCDRSERTKINPERYQRVIQSAMKQSLQTYLPVLNEALSFTQFLQTVPNGQKLIAHCFDSPKKFLKEVVQPKTSVLILIGPEGDFSLEEIQLAENNNFIPVSLGNNRLRTETAALVACHTLALINQ